MTKKQVSFQLDWKMNEACFIFITSQVILQLWCRRQKPVLATLALKHGKELQKAHVLMIY